MLGPLLLVSLSHNLGGEGQATAVIGTVLVGLREWTVQFVYLLAGVGGLLLCFALFGTGLVPRSLAVLGLVGYGVLLAGAPFDMLGHIDTVRGAGVLAFVPGGLFELLLPLRLFTKGFALPGIAHAPETALLGAGPDTR